MLAKGIGPAKWSELLNDASRSGSRTLSVVHLTDNKLTVVSAGRECVIIDGPLHSAHVQASGAALGGICSIAERAGTSDEGPRSNENDRGGIE